MIKSTFPDHRHRLLLRYGSERRDEEAETENDRESDPPHAHLGWGWLAGV